MQTTIEKLPIGARFFFKGDWRTEPGEWEVVGEKDCGMIPCKSDFHGASDFFGTVHVEALSS